MIDHYELHREEDKASKQKGRDLLRKRKLGRNKEDTLEARDVTIGTDEKPVAAPAQPLVPSSQSSPAEEPAQKPASDAAGKSVAGAE